ncbi:MAG: factor-independent urate hydroxylase, partial [Acidobacteriota bacterium]
MSDSTVILAENDYGKCRVRMVRVGRHGDRHELQEINVRIAFEGDFEAAHISGDNSSVLPTDTMKNTVYALAKQTRDIEEIEAFAQRLAAHFLANTPETSRVLIEIEEGQWNRLEVGGKPHRHSFVKGSDEKRTVTVNATRANVVISSGVEDLLVLKTTGSSFEAFKKDELTTLKEADDRILATSVKAQWTYTEPGVACRALWRGVRQLLLETFAEHDSQSVQHTVYAIGECILNSFEEVSEVSLSLPNKHCLLVDLSP